MAATLPTGIGTHVVDSNNMEVTFQIQEAVGVNCPPQFRDGIEVTTNGSKILQTGNRALPTGVDSDNDGVPYISDNCPTNANPDRNNTGKEGVGDVYNSRLDSDSDYDQIDTDNDDLADSKDNCPTNANQDQTDNNRDEIGNVCDLEV